MKYIHSGSFSGCVTPGAAPFVRARSPCVTPHPRLVARAPVFCHAGSVNDRPRNAADAPVPASPAELTDALRGTGYLADDGLATAAFLALRMNRPLFCE